MRCFFVPYLLCLLCFLVSCRSAPLVAPAKTVQPTVYLTSDDGPIDGTAQVLAAVETHQVPITFFLIGSQLAESSKHRDTMKALRESRNVLLGNHSYSHALYYSRFYNEPDYTIEDFKKAEALIHRGNSAYIARLPARNFFSLPGLILNQTELFATELKEEAPVYKKLSSSKYAFYGWDYYWGRSLHSGRPKPASGADAAIEAHLKLLRGKTVKPGKLIISLHDDMFSERFGGGQPLVDFIQALKNKGLVFDFISNY